MKKFLVIILVCLLALGSFSVIFASAETSNNANVQPTAANNSVYLVPGSYMNGSVKINNTVSTNANVKKLSSTECAAIFTDNAYLCTLAEGEPLPTPSSNRKDKEGNSYTFNGWWAIVDATVTYFTKVPSMSVAPFLYADWRADLSQRMDPVESGSGPIEDNSHYMMITHANGDEEKVTLFHTGTDRANAEQLGYGYAVQLYNYIELNPGDRIEIWTTGLGEEPDAQVAPISIDNYRDIVLESNQDGSNNTANYLTATFGSNWREIPYLTYKADLMPAHFNIYIKFFAGGSIMNVYLEPAD